MMRAFPITKASSLSTRRSSTGGRRRGSVPPIKAIVSALRQQGIPASVSQTAGTFVCNHVMYGLLHQLQGKSGQKGGFIHIPYLPEQAAAHPGQASMSVATVRAALETAIAVALEQDDDVKIGGGATH